MECAYETNTKFPSLPGVYLFKQDDQLLYVGKAKNLKKRVTSYFQKQKTDWKIEALLEGAYPYRTYCHPQ